jgi:hypothetical protein
MTPPGFPVPRPDLLATRYMPFVNMLFTNRKQRMLRDETFQLEIFQSHNEKSFALNDCSATHLEGVSFPGSPISVRSYYNHKWAFDDEIGAANRAIFRFAMVKFLRRSAVEIVDGNSQKYREKIHREF